MTSAVNGEEVKEVKLDFEAIRGKDLIAAEKEVRKMGDTTPAVFLSMDFQALVAAKLIGVPVEDVLSYALFPEVTLNFLRHSNISSHLHD